MKNQDKSGRKQRDRAGQTSRPDTSGLVDGSRLPEEVTGRASKTDEDVSTLFSNGTAQHLADGFRGGSNADRGSDLTKEEDTDPDADEDVTAA